MVEHRLKYVVFFQITDVLTDIFILTLKRLGGQFDPPCGFAKNVSSKEQVKPWFFVTFNIIISYIFPENFIEITLVVQKISIIFLSMLAVFIDFH